MRIWVNSDFGWQMYAIDDAICVLQRAQNISSRRVEESKSSVLGSTEIIRSSRAPTDAQFMHSLWSLSSRQWAFSVIWGAITLDPISPQNESKKPATF